MDRLVTLIAAMARNRAIGFAGRMPWHLPGELQHFRQMTMGKPVVMGRKTWETIGRPLPGRQNIVLTRQAAYRADGCAVVQSLEDAVRIAAGSEVMIIGGSEIYRLALPRADRMILTRVDCLPEADTWFPEFEPDDWHLTCRHAVAADARNAHAYEVLEFVRVARRASGTDQP